MQRGPRNHELTSDVGFAWDWEPFERDVAIALPDEYQNAEWEVEAHPRPTRQTKASNALALEYMGLDWSEAASGVVVPITCECGSVTTEIDFGEP